MQFIWDQYIPELSSQQHSIHKPACCFCWWALCPAPPPVHAVPPKILLLGTLFLFPTKNEKRADQCTAFSHVYFEPLLGQHSSFFHVVVHIKQTAWKYKSSTLWMLFLDYHILTAFINVPASYRPEQISLHVPFLSMGQKEVFAFLNGKPASICCSRFEVHKTYDK